MPDDIRLNFCLKPLFGLFFDTHLEWTVQYDLFSTIRYWEYGIFLKRRCWLLFSVDNDFKTVVSLVIKKSDWLLNRTL